jgi:hypothetical protein
MIPATKGNGHGGRVRTGTRHEGDSIVRYLGATQLKFAASSMLPCPL